MTMNPIINFTVDKFFNGVYDFLEKIIYNKKIKELLECNQQSHKINVFDSYSNDEAYDWQGLVDYINRDIFKIIADCFLLPNREARQKMINQTYRSAYSFAKAHSVRQQKRVNEFLQESMSIIGNALLDKTDDFLPYNIVVDEVYKIVEMVEAEVKEGFKSYSDFIVGEIKQKIDQMEYKDSFAYWIDNISMPPAVNTLFHYRNPNIVFHGRANEIAILDKFLSDAAPLLFTAVTGSAGSGKSKLFYEYAKSMENNAEWKVVFLTAANNTKNLARHKNYSYPLNMLIIIDYAGDHSIELAEWMVTLRTCKSMPPKLRIVLIERGSIGEREGRNINPLWYDRMLSVRSNEDINTQSLVPNGAGLATSCNSAYILGCSHILASYMTSVSSSNCAPVAKKTRLSSTKCGAFISLTAAFTSASLAT